MECLLQLIGMMPGNMSASCFNAAFCENMGRKAKSHNNSLLSAYLLHHVVIVPARLRTPNNNYPHTIWFQIWGEQEIFWLRRNIVQCHVFGCYIAIVALSVFSNAWVFAQVDILCPSSCNWQGFKAFFCMKLSFLPKATTFVHFDSRYLLGTRIIA